MLKKAKAMKIQYLTTLLLALIIIVSGCKKKESDPDPVPYANFTVDGVKKEYNFHTNFNKFCIDVHFCGSFWESDENENINYIQVGLPSFVKSGETYVTTQGGGGSRLIFVDANGNMYRTDMGGTVTFNIELWEGSNGWVKGTFSGSAVNEDDPVNDSIVIQDGYFQGKIWYISTK